MARLLGSLHRLTRIALRRRTKTVMISTTFWLGANAPELGGE